MRPGDQMERNERLIPIELHREQGPIPQWMGLYLGELIDMIGLPALLSGEFEPVYWAGSGFEWRGNRPPAEIAAEIRGILGKALAK